MCIHDIIQILPHCTVKIQIGNAHGTGFFIDANTILTSEHVIGDVSVGDIRVTCASTLTSQAIVPDIRVQGVRRADDPTKLDAALLYLDASLLQEGKDFEVVHLLPDWRQDDEIFIYGFQFTERGFNGLPLLGKIVSETPFNGMPLVRFTGDRVAGGMSGAPVLNKQTGAVVGVVKSTEDPNASGGAHFVPVSEIFRHLPEVFERNRSFFAAVPNHRWRRCEATLLRQHRGASLLRSTAHQWLLIGNGYFPFLPDHASKCFPEVTRAPRQLQATLNELPAEMRPEVHSLVDQPASKIEAGMTAACAYPSQSSVLIYWGSHVYARNYQVLHYASTATDHPSNIHLYRLKQWVEQLVLADKSVFLVLDLREIAIQQWLQADYPHPCIAFVG